MRESDNNREPVWMVLRYEPTLDRMWREVGCVNMPDPHAAFRHVVLRDQATE